MSGERHNGEGDEAYPAGEGAGGGESSDEEETFPGGVESDEGQRPGEKLEDGPPGLLEDPPRAD